MHLAFCAAGSKGPDAQQKAKKLLEKYLEWVEVYVFILDNIVYYSMYEYLCEFAKKLWALLNEFQKNTQGHIYQPEELQQLFCQFLNKPLPSRHEILLVQ